MKDTLTLIGAITYVLVGFGLIVGYVMNIFRLVGDAVSGEVMMMVVRIIGLFIFPAGGIIGYIPT